MFKKLSVLLIATAMLTACSEQTASQVELSGDQAGVIGGDLVASGSKIAVSTVGLYDSGSGSLCTGTLIGQNLVLTAAHCITPNSNKLIVYFGKDLKNNPDSSLIRKSDDAIVHEKYNPERGEDTYDIALVSFEGTTPAGFAPAPLLSNFSQVEKGTKVHVAGFGLNWAWGVKKGAGVLRTTELKVKRSLYGSTEIMLDQSLRKGICSGDSGGPAYLEVNGKLHLLGVASRGDSLPIPLTPDCFILSIFTRVDAHAAWISKTAELLR
ncbi:trypsin-like serine protease [Bdellovibrio bacteriovorus]